jgi:hypothetical protein
MVAELVSGPCGTIKNGPFFWDESEVQALPMTILFILPCRIRMPAELSFGCSIFQFTTIQKMCESSTFLNIISRLGDPRRISRNITVSLPFSLSRSLTPSLSVSLRLSSDAGDDRACFKTRFSLRQKNQNIARAATPQPTMLLSTLLSCACASASLLASCSAVLEWDESGTRVGREWD